MTTESPRHGRACAGGIDPRRSLLALLASVYVIAWWSFAARFPRSSELPGVSPGAGAAHPPGRVVWYGELPSSQRPLVQLPEGWRIAARPAESPRALAPEAAPVPRRVASAHPGRIRTRSS